MRGQIFQSVLPINAQGYIHGLITRRNKSPYYTPDRLGMSQSIQRLYRVSRSSLQWNISELLQPCT